VESLNRFNAKFQPDWHARYLLYPSIPEFAQVVWAILRAEKFIAGFGARNK
jgi:lysyl-tRNA synthetase class 2